jgi:AraC-like DNA-binding protein
VLDLYKHSLETNYRKLDCDGILFVEYKCIPGKSELDSLWSENSHLVFVTSGYKTWITPEEEVTIYKGQAIFCKNGACMMRNFYETEFCALIMFFTQDFIKEVSLEYQISLKKNEKNIQTNFQITKVNVDENLKLYFESVNTFVFQKKAPSELLLKLKFKELILQVLNNDNNPKLKSHFLSILQDGDNKIEAVVRKNLCFNLSIDDYACLCNRSLSSFKRDFKQEFGESPLRWLIKERLKYAKARLLSINESINDLAMFSGFESTEHFIRCFKKYYGEPPLRFKSQYLKHN